MLRLFKPYAFKVFNMSDTPQNDVATDELVSADVETNDSVVESDTTNDVQVESKEQVDEVEVAKQKANDAFNKQYGQLKQAERERDANQNRLDELEKADRERQAAAVGNIPTMPDAFDDDFEGKVKIRDEAIAAQANYNATNQAYLNQQQQIQQQEQAQAAVKQNEAIASYSQKATEFGINQSELQAAGNTVGNYGLSQDLIMHILQDTDGPLITKHLAANPQDGYQLASMSPFAVGGFLDGIKTKASALKPKTSSAPEPVTNLSGNGVDPEMGKYSHIKGAKFE